MCHVHSTHRHQEHSTLLRYAPPVLRRQVIPPSAGQAPRTKGWCSVPSCFQLVNPVEGGTNEPSGISVSGANTFAKAVPLWATTHLLRRPNSPTQSPLTMAHLSDNPKLSRNEEQWKADCLKERGKELTGKYTHYCIDWDGLTMDETCEEWPCLCAYDKTGKFNPDRK